MKIRTPFLSGNLKLLSFIFFIFIAFTSSGQSMLGLHSDNYAGVYSIGYNPAEIVDSRYKIHVNISSVSGSFSSNYFGLRRESFFGDGQNIFKPTELFNSIAENINYYKVQRADVDNRRFYVEGELSTFPSFMMNFSKGRVEHAIGFSFKQRYQGAATGVLADLTLLSYVNTSILNNNFGTQDSDVNLLQLNVWNEYALTYGRTIINRGKNYVTAAATLKLNQGYAGSSLEISRDGISYSADNVQPNLISRDTKVDFSDTVLFQNSKVLSSQGRGLGSIDISNIFSGKSIGFGVDLGFVWEFRPNLDKAKYVLDGYADYLDPSKEKYLFKLGVGITDIGYVPYDSFAGDNAQYSLNVQGAKLGDIVSVISNGLIRNYRYSGISNVLNSTATNKQDKSNTFNVMLPAKLNVYADFRVADNFYINAAASISPEFCNCQMRGISQYSITPRFEKKWFGVSLPISANNNENGSIGASLRAGPLVIGMRDILPFFGKKQIYETNAYASLSIPIFKKIKDQDKDHVSDYYDECKEKGGPWENKGCPYDSDKDGVEDAQDMCPDEKGTKENQGCIDTDKDGIHDGIDRCVDKVGEAEFYGCPDTDNDGISDNLDICPEVSGSKEYSGCPDTDEDTIHDGIDDCINVPGEEVYYGCPDTDGDTIRDIDDKCPDVFGKVIYDGCPPAPPVIDEAYRMFDSNIVDLSDDSLDNMSPVLKFMEENPEYNLHIGGHTDATAAIPYNNLVIGRQRALRLKEFFVRKGISKSRIFTKSYGEVRPVDTNTTREGRTRNRRVELRFESDKWPETDSNSDSKDN